MAGSAAAPEASGRSFTGLTVSVKLVDVLPDPSLAVSVIVELPKPLPASQMSSSRLAPLPACVNCETSGPLLLLADSTTSPSGVSTSASVTGTSRV